MRQAGHTRRAGPRLWFVVAGLVVFAALLTWYLQGAIPRRIVMATGLADGMYHELAQRYKAILARDGVTIVERATHGSGDNLRLLADPGSDVDVAFVQGGTGSSDITGVEMLAGLYYEAMWVFYRDPGTLSQLDHLRGKRIAIGPEGSGVRVFALPLLTANDVTTANSRLEAQANVDAVHALQRGDLDVAILIGPAQAQAVALALRDPSLKLMSMARADAYPRLFHHVRKLSLPAGAIDLARDIPSTEVTLLGTKAMLVARADLSNAIVDLLLDAARETHAEAGFFETNSEFPTVERVDLPVSQAAERHHRFGPRVLHRYMPFFMATYLERLIVVLLPLIVVIVPIVNFLPQILRWRTRSRIYRWYGELALLELEVESHAGTPPTQRWLADLERIERAAARVRAPASYAGEWYTLREHIEFVRRAVQARAAVAP